MQADRENTIAMQDAGVEEITSSPELYVKYLDMQGDNPTSVSYTHLDVYKRQQTCRRPGGG